MQGKYTLKVSNPTPSYYLTGEIPESKFYNGMLYKKYYICVHRTQNDAHTFPQNSFGMDGRTKATLNATFLSGDLKHQSYSKMKSTYMYYQIHLF